MSAMHPRLLLFDIDGTLLKSSGAGLRAMRDVAAEMFGVDFTWEGVVAAGNLDPCIFAEAVAINGIEHRETLHEQFRDAYLARLRAELAKPDCEVIAMPAVHDILEALRSREENQGDVALGLLTGNYANAVPMKLRAVGLDPAWFTITAFGDEARTRPGLVELALARLTARHGGEAAPDRVMVIGDTPRDVHCGKVHGCVVLAVETGGYCRAELLDAGADYAITDFRDAEPLWQWLGHDR